QRMKQTIRTSMLFSLSISAVLTLLFALFPRELIMIFIKDEEIVRIGTLTLQAYVYAIPIAAVGMIMMSSLQAMGKALPALIVSLSRQGIMYIPAILILNNLFQFEGLVFAMPLADLLTSILSTTMLIVIVRNLKQPKEKKLKVGAPIPET
ncbi:MAG: MATE family efflux transporter, partial [Candidatus Cloacimonetes bacterium]|nr:MATE family efflux transporter [Candidatus Cloacimonadota bacterium]